MARIGRTVVDDLLSRTASQSAIHRQQRIDAGLAWLCRAQDAGSDRGFSYGYTIKGGWQDSYIETTGYIIETFIEAAAQLGRADLADRAVEAGDWLLSVQLDDGSFPNPSVSPSNGLVFDTGQDLFGLLALAEYSDEDRFVQAAQRAAQWLVDVADEDNRWTRYTYNSSPHVYNTRVAWALTLAGQKFDCPSALEVAKANLDWACDQQVPNGWFENCAFSENEAPFTHNTAYAGRGLLEAGLLLGEERYVVAARRVAAAASRHLQPDGSLPGRIATNGRKVSNSVCLTGSAQFAIIWMKLHQIYRGTELYADALCALEAVGASQSTTGPDETRGALRGSNPVWGRYAPLGYPNWATKFFVEALLLADRTSQDHAR